MAPTKRPLSRADPARNRTRPHSRLHTTRILRLSEDLPVVIEIVDEAPRIEVFLPQLDEMVTEGMVTLEKVRVIAYRAPKPQG